jgi:DNA polymerase-2
LIPDVLGPLLARRAFYKARLKEGALDPALRQRYDACQSALKWIGVTSFGYLGYRNAHFGRIESHEAVTAFGREKLLTAKEVCEAHGYVLLHALTDSVWIRKLGVTEEALQALCEQITRATGVTMELEGRYRWVVFLPSKVRTDISVATRYFGVFADGTLKARGPGTHVGSPHECSVTRAECVTMDRRHPTAQMGASHAPPGRWGIHGGREDGPG